MEVNRLEKLVNERADSIVARAQEEAKMDKVKVIIQQVRHVTRRIWRQGPEKGKVQGKKSL